MKQSFAEAPSPKKSDVPEQYEIENAADTLTKAEEIKKNKKLFPHVQKHLAKKVKTISSIAELRKHVKSKLAEGSPQEEAGESVDEEASEA